MGPELAGMGLLCKLLPLFVRTSSTLCTIRSGGVLMVESTGLKRHASFDFDS